MGVCAPPAGAFSFIKRAGSATLEYFAMSLIQCINPIF
jgi:hypothetical protein